MDVVIEKLIAAVNAHDLDAMVALFDPHYDSRQPAHPGRAFVGRSQVRANWAAMFAGVPDFRCETGRIVEDGDTTWCEWAWLGTHADGRPFEMRGVALFLIVDRLIAAGTLYVEEVEAEEVGIDEAVESLAGRRPEVRDDVDPRDPLT
ncbi:MAG: nuclear transport factor 2 family protein [Leifsonia sp.]